MVRGTPRDILKGTRDGSFLIVLFLVPLSVVVLAIFFSLGAVPSNDIALHDRLYYIIVGAGLLATLSQIGLIFLIIDMSCAVCIVSYIAKPSILTICMYCIGWSFWSQLGVWALAMNYSV